MSLEAELATFAGVVTARLLASEPGAIVSWQFWNPKALELRVYSGKHCTSRTFEIDQFLELSLFSVATAERVASEALALLRLQRESEE